LLEEAVELYKEVQDSQRIYQYLEKKLPQSAAYRWAFYRISSIVKLESRFNTKTQTSP
jgi:hypothetical protein